MAKSNLKRQPVMTNSVGIFQILKRIPNISEEEARVLANEITHNRDVATKTDLMELRLDLETKISETKSDLEAKISETKSGLEAKISETKSGLEAKIAELQKELRHTIWVVAGLLLTAQGVTFAAVGFLF